MRSRPISSQISQARASAAPLAMLALPALCTYRAVSSLSTDVLVRGGGLPIIGYQVEITGQNVGSGSGLYSGKTLLRR